MNRTTKIKRIGDELNAFVEDNLNQLDPYVISKKAHEVAEKYGLKENEIVDSDGLEGIIRRQYLLIGDLILFVVDYDPVEENATGKGAGVDVVINSQIAGITDKELFIKSLDTDTKAGRIIYNMLTGKDIKERFS